MTTAQTLSLRTINELDRELAESRKALAAH
jgi:hypothetical protein